LLTDLSQSENYVHIVLANSFQYLIIDLYFMLIVAAGMVAHDFILLIYLLHVYILDCIVYMPWHALLRDLNIKFYAPSTVESADPFYGWTIHLLLLYENNLLKHIAVYLNIMEPCLSIFDILSFVVSPGVLLIFALQSFL